MMCSVLKKGLKFASKNLLSTLALEFGAAHSLIGFVVISRKKSPQESPPITPRLMHITSRGYLAHHRPILKYTGLPTPTGSVSKF